MGGGWEGEFRAQLPCPTCRTGATNVDVQTLAARQHRPVSSLIAGKNADDGRQSGGGSFKVGGLRGQRFKIRRDAMDRIIDLLMFYKHRQRHSSLGCVSPMQFERDWLPPRTGRLRNGPNYGLRKPQEGRASSGSTIRARCGAALT